MTALTGVNPNNIASKASPPPNPIREQAEPRRVGPIFRPGPDLGAVGTRAARHAPAQGTAASIRQAGDPGAEATPTAAQSRLRLFPSGARPYCPTVRRTDPARGRRPGRTRPPDGDRPRSPFPYAAGHWRQGVPIRALPRSVPPPRRPRASLPPRRPEQVSCKERMRNPWVAVIGGRPLGNTPREG